MSASTTPTESPRSASATATLTVTDDLPTPPLPDATAYTLVSDPGRANGISFAWAPPRTRSCNWRRCASSITSSTTWTSLTPLTAETAAVTSLVIVSRIGQPGTVSQTPTVTAPAGLIA